MNPGLSELETKWENADFGGGELNWREERDILWNIYQRSDADEEKSDIIELLQALMDIVERVDGVIADVEAFIKYRRKQHEAFLLSECIQNASINLVQLYAVTLREIAAGRMIESDELHKLALAAKEALRFGAAMTKNVGHKGALAAVSAAWPRGIWSRSMLAQGPVRSAPSPRRFGGPNPPCRGNFDATPCPAAAIRRFTPPEPMSGAGGVKPFSKKTTG